MKHLKSILIIGTLIMGLSFFVFPSRSFADPTSTKVTCVDSSGGTHQVTAAATLADPGNILNEKDFKKSCRQKGWTYQAPTIPQNNTGSSSDLQACEASGGLQPDPALCGTPCKDADNCNLVTRYANPLINKFLAPLAILAVIIGIIWGAIQYITSAGDAQKVAEGKSKIQKALFGLLAFIFLYALLNWLIPGGLL